MSFGGKEGHTNVQHSAEPGFEPGTKPPSVKMKNRLLPGSRQCTVKTRSFTALRVLLIIYTKVLLPIKKKIT